MKYLFLFITLIASFSFAESNIALISVNGIVEKSIDPNMLQLSIEIWAKANTAKGAQTLQATQFQVTKAVIEKMKIKKEDWQTAHYQVGAETQYDPKTQKYKQIGFKATQNISLTLRKIDEAGELIDALIPNTEDPKHGVRIDSARWDSDQKAVVEASAIAAAYNVAKSRAEEIARAADVKIKRPFHIQHTSDFAMNESVSSIVQAKRINFAAEMSDSAPMPKTELSPGKIKVNVTVNADFEI